MGLFQQGAPVDRTHGHGEVEIRKSLSRVFSTERELLLRTEQNGGCFPHRGNQPPFFPDPSFAGRRPAARAVMFLQRRSRASAAGPQSIFFLMRSSRGMSEGGRQFACARTLRCAAYPPGRVQSTAVMRSSFRERSATRNTRWTRPPGPERTRARGW